MTVDMLMPQMGESIAEATISKWLKAPGDRVEKDEVILEISTDKVDSEIPAPASGVLSEVLYKEGDVVPVKTLIARIDSQASGASATPAAAAPASPAPASNGNAANSGRAHAYTAPSAAPQATYQSGGCEISSSESDRFYSPLVKNLAAKHGIALSELNLLSGSGQNSRFTKQDFMNYIEGRGGKVAPQYQAEVMSSSHSHQPVAAASSAPAVAKSTTPALSREGVTEVPMDSMRKAIADHMVRSKHTSPHVYSIQEVDCSRISAYRAQHKDEFKKKEGFNLSYTPFFLEAAVKALREFPYVNASLDGHTILLKKDINLGCAVALGNTGLIVPVIKKADEKNMVGIARGLNDMALRARDKKLSPDDVQGGTFTVTNPGIFGTIIGTPIINQPQVAILCLGAIKKRVVVVDDMIAIREMCYLTLSYDHRIVDGSLGGAFLKFIGDYLENWDMNRSLF
jgi:2-oxoglutarate dehydrogenase E2 component (dihydrolipoamide succinyltransferase)